MIERDGWNFFDFQIYLWLLVIQIQSMLEPIDHVSHAFKSLLKLLFLTMVAFNYVTKGFPYE